MIIFLKDPDHIRDAKIPEFSETSSWNRSLLSSLLFKFAHYFYYRYVLKF